MHEHSLIRSLLQLVRRTLQEHPGRKMLRVRVSLGEFGGVDPLLLEMAWQEAISGTEFADTLLTLESVPLEARCRICGGVFPVRAFCFECSDCGGREVDIVRGDGMMLEQIELE